MNFLAHSLLAFGDDDILVGQFAGDFVRGADLSMHPPAVAKGIRLHRRVDAFADRHASTRALRASFPEPLRRFAGIAIDIAADYHLVQGWQMHALPLANGTLAEHAHYVDRVLANKREVLPTGLQRFADVLRSEQLLISWGTVSGVEIALQRLSRRAPAFAPLAECIPVLWEREEALSRYVAELWPAMVTATRAQYRQLDHTP